MGRQLLSWGLGESAVLQVCLGRGMVVVADEDGIIYLYPLDNCFNNDMDDSQLCVRAHNIFSGRKSRLLSAPG